MNEERRLGVLLNAGDSLALMRAEGQESRFSGTYLAAWKTAFEEVAVFSYANESRRTTGHRVVPGKPGWPGLLYGLLLPIVHRRTYRSLTLARVMQTLGALPALVGRLLFGVPYVVTYGFDLVANLRLQKGGVYPYIGHVVRRLALRHARLVIVTTPTLQREVTRWADPAKVRLIPNGVDLGRFTPVESRLSRERTARCLFVGRLAVDKNLLVLIDALSRVPHPVSLTLAGDGPMRGEVERAAKERGVEVTFPGTVPHEKMPDVYRESDLFVLVSQGEGHPKALVEAFACALPCVGSRVPGIGDVIDDGINGVLCAPEPDAVASAITGLIEDPARAGRLGRAAREKALATYDINRTIESELAVLKEAIRG